MTEGASASGCAAGQQHIQWVVEEMDELDVGGRGVGFEGVLEDDRDVELGGCECAQGGTAVDEHVFDDVVLPVEELGVARFEPGGELGREEDQRGEERSESHVSGAQAGELRDLRFGKLEPVEDDGRVLDQQLPRLGGVDTLLRASHQLRADASLEQ